MNNNQKHPELSSFQALIAEELSQQEVQRIESHLDECLECQQQLERATAEDQEWSKTQTHLSDSNLLRPDDWMINQQTVAIGPLPGTDDVEVEMERVESPADMSQYDRMALDPPTHPEMLGRIDEYEVEKVIGRGGCGVVYKAFDRELNRPVAIKVLAPHLASSGIARQRFAREARAAAAVVHPNVVPIHGVNSEPKRPYIVMTLVNGRSLDAHVREQGQLEVKDIVRIAQQIASGLAAAHRQGLIHRDIKPANILMEQDISRVMITDFGLARAANEAAITQTGWLAGTPHYMSPEQASGDEIDQRSDLFSLGSLIYFMATGREPFHAEKPFAIIQKIIFEEPTRPRQLNSDIPKTLERLIQKLLSKSAKSRFQSAEEVQHTLENYLAHLQSPLVSPKPKIKLDRKSNRWPWLMLFTASLVAIAMIWIGYLRKQDGSGLQPILTDSNPASTDQLAPPLINNTSTANNFEFSFFEDDSALKEEIRSLMRDLEQIENELGGNETSTKFESTRGQDDE
jgi:serine/threonine-protein kinase